jgi:uncharacterized protein YndB with AHSA1/START domain
VSIRVETRSSAPPERVWALYAQPERWREWAPHVRSPRGLGDPEVQAGARGSVRLGGAVPVRARIVAVVSKRHWAWRVGPAELRHDVEPTADGGTLIGLEFEAPAALELAFRITYAPVTALLLRNLARVAER